MRIVKNKQWLNRSDGRLKFFNDWHSNETKQKIGNANKGKQSSSLNKIWITNGINEKMIRLDVFIPENWYKGRVSREGIFSKEQCYKISERMKNNQNAKGYKRTDAERKKISERMIGNQFYKNAKPSRGMLGKRHTEETKQKIRLAAILREKRKHEQRI